MLKFIHTADFHLDSAFAALTPQQAAARRRESRDLPVRLANYVNQNGIELVLLAGDLFDSADAYRDTCLLYTSPSPRDRQKSRMPSSA